MGLDIAVHTGLKPVANANNWEDYELFDESYDSETIFLSGSWFRLDGSELAKGQICTMGSYYADSFRASSYSGYNRWRNELSLVILKVPAKTVWNDEDTYKGQPFYNIISFTDCDGTIAGSAAKKLADDFEKHRGQVSKCADDFIRLYDRFTEAFRLAADHDGIVVFK